MKRKLATIRATLGWVRKEAVDAVLAKRDERNFDRGMLAGLETAENAIRFGPAPQAIQQARKGYEQEMASR